MKKDRIDNSAEVLSEDKIEKVAGGKEPEEFDWRGEGYVTPTKKEPSGESFWRFSAEGNVEGQYFKKITEGKD